MSIPVGNTDVDRTLELIVRTPANGRYELVIQRHVVDLTTEKEVSKDLTPITFTLEDLKADEQLAHLMAGLPDVIDRIVQERRAAIETRIAAELAAEAAAAEAAEAERQHIKKVADLERTLLQEQQEYELKTAADAEATRKTEQEDIEAARAAVEAEMRAVLLANANT